MEKKLQTVSDLMTELRIGKDDQERICETFKQTYTFLAIDHRYRLKAGDPPTPEDIEHELTQFILFVNYALSIPNLVLDWEDISAIKLATTRLFRHHKNAPLTLNTSN